MANTQSPEQKQAPIVEVVARSVRLRCWSDDEAAEFALRIIEDLAAAGYVIVPCNATAAMQVAGAHQRENGKSVLDIWFAMVEASR